MVNMSRRSPAPPLLLQFERGSLVDRSLLRVPLLSGSLSFLSSAAHCLAPDPLKLRPHVKGKGNPYSIAERRVPELIPVFGSQPVGYVSHKPGGRLPLLSARPAVTIATLKRAAISFSAW